MTAVQRRIAKNGRDAHSPLHAGNAVRQTTSLVPAPHLWLVALSSALMTVVPYQLAAQTAYQRFFGRVKKDRTRKKTRNVPVFHLCSHRRNLFLYDFNLGLFFALDCRRKLRHGRDLRVTEQRLDSSTSEDVRHVDVCETLPANDRRVYRCTIRRVLRFFSPSRLRSTNFWSSRSSTGSRFGGGFGFFHRSQTQRSHNPVIMRDSRLSLSLV